MECASNDAIQYSKTWSMKHCGRKLNGNSNKQTNKNKTQQESSHLKLCRGSKLLFRQAGSGLLFAVVVKMQNGTPTPQSRMPWLEFRLFSWFPLLDKAEVMAQVCHADWKPAWMSSSWLQTAPICTVSIWRAASRWMISIIQINTATFKGKHSYSHFIIYQNEIRRR